jgi:hypothetical protein
VTVVSTTKPKSQPNEILADMAVSAATKLQRLRVRSVSSLTLYFDSVSVYGVKERSSRKWENWS